MGGLSIWHWMIVLVVVAVVFGGRGKLSSIMGDAAKGIKEFKNGLKDEDQKAASAPPPAPAASSAPLPSDVGQREHDKV